MMTNVGGLASPTNFMVTIAPPRGLNITSLAPNNNEGAIGNKMNASMMKTLAFMCHVANLPGIYLTSHDTLRYGYGPAEKFPHLAGFNALNLVFYFDQKTLVYDFFTAWLKLIVNHDMRKGIQAGSGVQQGQTPYEVSYKSEYATEIDIQLFSKTNKVIKRVVCLEAFPMMVTDIPLNWEAVDSMMKCHVVIAYRDWYDADRLIQKRPTQ